jgi:hypothetical protein
VRNANDTIRSRAIAKGGIRMNLMFPIGLAAALTGSVITIADGPRNFNVAAGCKAAAAINQEMDLAVSQSYQSCMNDEASARAQLTQSWSNYAAADKSRCIGQTEDGGMPSYVEVQECLQITVGVNDPVPLQGVKNVKNK